MNDVTHALPRRVQCGGEAVELRNMSAGDEASVLAFARTIPTHDLLFLRRDITQQKVVEAWVKATETGDFITVLAWNGEKVVGCAAVVRDPLSWSPHVAELRVVIAESMRGKGLGHLLTQEAFSQALKAGAEKLTAQMTLDQKGAQAVFEGLGFSVEAMLRDHVRDRDGKKHDVLILSHDVARVSDRHSAYGLNEAF